MTALSCGILKGLIGDRSLVRACDALESGVLRLETPFQYPDGSSVDLFLAQRQDLLHPFVLTDLGQTTAFLLDLQIKHWATKRRKQIVSDICRSLDVQLDGGEFLIELPEDGLKNLPEAMVRLAQTCIRVSDLIFTQRLRSLLAFRDDFEEFISASSLPYEADASLPGRFGKPVLVEYKIRGNKVESLLQTMSTGNAQAAHGIATEIFARWYDLVPQRKLFQFVSVYDSTNNVFREQDLTRLKDVSTVLAFPADEQQLREALAA